MECRLCGRSDQSCTPEHIIPRWLSDYLAPQFPLGFRLYVEDTPITQFEPRITQTIQVCRPCNGWLNEWIEQPAQEIIKALVGGARNLTKLERSQQMRTALWLY